MVKSHAALSSLGKAHINYHAYDDVENMKRFDSESFQQYCQSKLDSCDKHVKFIKEHCVNNNASWGGNIVEIGSGNSKLLINLEQSGVLNSAIGYELSESRNRFAEAFCTHEGVSCIENVCGDFLDGEVTGNADLVIAVDIVAQLVSPTNPEAENKMLDWIYNQCKKNGFALFELWDFEKIKAQLALSEGKLNVWEAFSKEDPFEFCLATLSETGERDILWQKKFLKRDSTERSFFEHVLRPYDRDDFCQLLKRVGFAQTIVYEHWNDDQNGEAGEYIVLARK
ncbi:class I SAM-dependent methyltransferase [Aestuariibacter sp. AA17]|uniref:Class I SAM-dependent methyltransferase n=1 Tax=Fluctibacter corallii TaxID=2984329 RepID=A0ABT3A9S4_9ALTE|nr:class I SAM-dependent methyltransferase [Aestuariibacter sp. AA17]MCV2885435.1 class I SAM-dependent methyltransferase [Aestuariibacter sp. AA17]